MSDSSVEKFYKYVFWFLFDVAITNAFILCKHFTDLGISDVQSFRKQLAKALIGSYCSRKHPGRPSVSLQPSKHFCPTHFPVQGAEKQHWCHYCSHYVMAQSGTVMIASYLYATVDGKTTAFYNTTGTMYPPLPLT